LTAVSFRFEPERLSGLTGNWFRFATGSTFRFDRKCFAFGGQSIFLFAGRSMPALDGFDQAEGAKGFEG
jgi:hypothetical protein